MRLTPNQLERNRHMNLDSSSSSSEPDQRMSLVTAQQLTMPTGSYNESKGRLPPLSSMLPPLKPRLSTGTADSPYGEDPRANSAKEVDGQTPDMHSRTNLERPMIARSESDSRFNPGLSDGSSELSEYRHGLSRSPNERTEMDMQATKQYRLERQDMDGQYHGSQSIDVDGHGSSYRSGGGEYGRSFWNSKEQETQDIRDQRSSTSMRQSIPSPAYLSPAMASATQPSYNYYRARTSTSDGQVFASNRSAHSPPPSIKTKFSSDPYSMDEHSTVSSSSSLRAPSHHFYRSQVRSSAKPYDIASTSSTEMDFFNQLWDVMLEVRRHIERFQRKSSAEGPRPLPSIRDCDIATLTSHLHYEIDVLSEADSRSADHFALDVRHLHDQFSQRRQNMRNRASTISMPSVRERSSFSHYQPQQQYHSSSSTSPPMHPRGSVSQKSQSASYYTSSMSGRYGHTPSSAPPITQGQEMNSPRYNYHWLEYSNQGRELMNQRGLGGFDRRTSSGYSTPMYDGRFTSGGPSSIQDDLRTMSTGHLGPGTNFHAHQGRMSQSMPRRVRKRRDEAEQSCLSCSAKETPEWRKGPTGPRTLCNACGLLYAKQCRKRELDLQANGKRQKESRTGGGDEMTQEERENNLLELQLAVQVRINNSNPDTIGMTSGGSVQSSYPNNETANNIGGGISSVMSNPAIIPNQQVPNSERSPPSLPPMMRQ